MTSLAAELVAAIFKFADLQRGLITHAQLLQCGVDRYAIKRLVRQGWLRPIHRGVYLVGPAAQQPYWRQTAAVLVYAPGALISHRDSLAVWKLIPADDNLDVHVTVVKRWPDQREGTRLHVVKKPLEPCDIGVCERLRVTKPARALLEAAHDLGMHETAKAVDEALALGLVTRADLLAVTERYPRHRGVRIIRELGDPNKASEITASMAEKRYGELLVKADAPPSETQYRIGPYRADRAWPQLNLVVEIDGVRVHGEGKRMEKDNKRQDYMRRHGQAVTRFTRRQVMFEPEYVMFRTGQEIGFAEARLGATAAGAAAARAAAAAGAARGITRGKRRRAA